MAARSRRAFTLVELLVVVAILALLLSILMPSLNRAKRLTRLSICGSNLRQIAGSFAAYAANHRGCRPFAGRFYNNHQMRYVHYWTESYPSSANTAGWQNFGQLSRTGLMNPQGQAWFCPLQRGVGLTWPGGEVEHANNVPGPKNEVLLDADSHLTWTIARTGYHRRSLGETSWSHSPPLALIGPRAFLADTFSTPDQIRTSHGDSVNVAYGPGHVSLRPLDPATSLMSGISNTYDSASYPIIQEIWKTFDQ